LIYFLENFSLLYPAGPINPEPKKEHGSWLEDRCGATIDLN